MEVRREKIVNLWRFNIPQLVATIISVGGVGVAMVLYISAIKSDVTLNQAEIQTLKAARDQRAQAVDNQIATLNTAVNQIPTLSYRVGLNEAGIVAANKRVDDIQNSVVQAIENFRKDLSDLSTDVKVQSNKIDTLSKKVDSFKSTAWQMRAQN